MIGPDAVFNVASYIGGIARRVAVGGAFVCCAGGVLAQDALFSLTYNGAMSERPLSTGEVLVVTVMSMQQGEEIWLSRCGNARCSVSSPVAKWTLEDFTRRSPIEVHAEDDRYAFYLYNRSNDNRDVMATRLEVEGGRTILQFESGTSVSVVVKASR